MLTWADELSRESSRTNRGERQLAPPQFNRQPPIPQFVVEHIESKLPEEGAGAADAATTSEASSPSEATPTEAEPTKSEEYDTIFVGGKPIMTYVNATLTQIKSAPIVTLKARGQRIRQAVDVALTIAKRMNAVGYTIGDVRISSNPMQSLDGKSRNISTIEIDIQKASS